MNEKQLINSGIVEIKENGEVFLKSNGKIINPKNNGNGYLRIYIPQIKKDFFYIAWLPQHLWEIHTISHK